MRGCWPRAPLAPAETAESARRRRTTRAFPASAPRAGRVRLACSPQPWLEPSPRRGRDREGGQGEGSGGSKVKDAELPVFGDELVACRALCRGGSRSWS